MPTGLSRPSSSASVPTSLVSLLLSLSLPVFTGLAIQARAAAASSSSNLLTRDQSNPLGIDWDPAPSPEDGPPGARDALRDPAYLPAQIGGIVGSYAVSLVLVALILLALSKRRRQRLQAAQDFDLWEEPRFTFDYGEEAAAFQSQNDIFEGSHYQAEQQRGSHTVAATAEAYRVHPLPFSGAYELPKSPGHGHVRNFSLPSPTSVQFDLARPRVEIPRFEASLVENNTSPSSYLPSPVSTTRGPLGQDPDVNQTVVQRDRAMAQAQLEEMYKYVMEQEEAKEAGVEFRAPMVTAPPPAAGEQARRAGHKKERTNKPASLNLSKPEKTQSRTSSILSALKSPLGKKNKPVQGLTISSPIMTPMSGTFPTHNSQQHNPYYAGEEMNAIPPRQYAPAVPPPLPAGADQHQHYHHHASFSERQNNVAAAGVGQHVAPLTPPDDLSPESTQSIDERMGAAASSMARDKSVQQRSGGGNISEEDEDDERDDYHHRARHTSQATMTEADPVSAVSATSQTPLVLRSTSVTTGPRTSGLPTSPKPGVNRFPSLPASPRPGATFGSVTSLSSSSRAAPPSAVRTGGTLPLRAYEPALQSPGTYDRTVKQTVFERAGGGNGQLFSPSGAPLTGNPVPYSPYQPFSPVVPVTPSLVTRADRKRMRKMEPKTPTLQMVQSTDELW